MNYPDADFFDHPAFHDVGEAGVFLWLMSMGEGPDHNIVTASLRAIAERAGRTKKWAESFIKRLQRFGLVMERGTGEGTARGTGRGTVATQLTLSVEWPQNSKRGTDGGTKEGTPEETREETRGRTRVVDNLIPFPSFSPKENPKENPPKGGQKKGEKKGPAFVLPEWVPVEAWEGWLEMRKANGWKTTDRAKQLAVNSMEKGRAAGHDPGKMLDYSTLNSYRGVFTDDRGDRTRASGREPLRL